MKEKICGRMDYEGISIGRLFPQLISTKDLTDDQ